MIRLRDWAIGGGVCVLALIAAFLVYIGYIGGPVLVALPPTTRPEPAFAGLSAVILSGDMGFRIGMAPRIARRLADNGIPVIGVNSLAYFRHRRTPDEAAALIAGAARRALARDPADKLILIGQSYGADMLHVGLAGMNPALRSKVSMVALVVPGETVSFRASPADILGFDAPVPALPTARQLTWTPLICIHGAEEAASLCPQLDQPNMRGVTLPGGHLLRRDADTLEAVLLQSIRAAKNDQGATSRTGGT